MNQQRNLKYDAHRAAKARTSSFLGGGSSAGQSFPTGDFPGLSPPSGWGGFVGGGNVPGGFSGNSGSSLFGGGGGSGGGSSLGNFSLNDIKGIVDRMGGIDGLIGTIGKMNKMMQTINQMSPMLKLLFSSFIGKAGTTDADEIDEESYLPPRKRKRKRTRRAVSKKRKQSASRRR